MPDKQPPEHLHRDLYVGRSGQQWLVAFDNDTVYMMPEYLYDDSTTLNRLHKWDVVPRKFFDSLDFQRREP